MLVDQDNITGSTFGVKIVPYAVALNSDGTVAAGPFRADIDKPEFWAACRRWATEGAIAKAWSHTLGSPLNERELRAVQYLARARESLRGGDKEEALRQLRDGFVLDPNNWLIRKQMWALEHPEQFYAEPRPNGRWQKERIQREESELKAR